MANEDQIRWSSGAPGKTIRLKVREQDHWYNLCNQRFIMDLQGAKSDEWLALAAEFDKCKSPACADLCRKAAVMG